MHISLFTLYHSSVFQKNLFPTYNFILYSMDIKALHLKLQEMRQSFFNEVSIFQSNEHINVY